MSVVKKYYVYIMSNSTNSVLYIGITNNLIRRIHEHKKGLFKGFSKRYKCRKLVYYDSSKYVDQAIAYEKKLKNWRRQWKINLIKKTNSDFCDLSQDFGFDFSQSLDPEINSG